MSPCFRTVLLDNKQKRGGGLSMPKTNVVRKVVTSGTVTNTPPGQHSQQSTAYSGLGPGRGHDQPRPAPAPYQHQHHSRPQSPMSRPPPPGSSPAPSPAASHSDQSRTSFPSATAPKPRPQVNTEIMKRPLRFVISTFKFNCHENNLIRIECPKVNLDPFSTVVAFILCGNFDVGFPCKWTFISLFK